MLAVVIITSFFACKKERSQYVACSPATVTDTDGNIYNTVKIGNQCWLQQNLKTSHYRNGAPILQVEDSFAWASIEGEHGTTPAWCYYNKDSANNTLYGKLYNWYAVSSPGQLCPTGFHVASDSDWIILIDYLGGDQNAGLHLKAKSFWTTYDNSDNSSGFSAMPGGERVYWGPSLGQGTEANFWTSTAIQSIDARFYTLEMVSGHVIYNAGPGGEGMSVRCVGD